MTKRLRVIGMTTVFTVIFFFIANAFGADLRVQTPTGGPTEEMSWIIVLLATLVAGLLGLLLAWVLDRFASGRTIWTVIAWCISQSLARCPSWNRPEATLSGRPFSIPCMRFSSSLDFG